MDLLPCSVSLTFDDGQGQGGGQGECLVWFWLLILRPDALPNTNNTLLVPGPRRYSLRRSIVMTDRRAINRWQIWHNMLKILVHACLMLAKPAKFAIVTRTCPKRCIHK